MCPRCEGRGTVSDIDLTELFDDSKSLAEGAITIPGYKTDSWWTTGIFIESGFLDPNKPIREYTREGAHDFLYKEPTKVKVKGVNLTYEGLIPKVQKSMLSKGPGLAAAAHPRLRRARRHLHRLSRVRRHPAQRGGAVLADPRHQHRRCLRDADQRPRRMGAAARASPRWHRCSRRCGRPSTPSSRSGWATSRSTGRRGRCRAARRSASR